MWKTDADQGAEAATPTASQLAELGRDSSFNGQARPKPSFLGGSTEYQQGCIGLQSLWIQQGDMCVWCDQLHEQFLDS